MKKYLSLVAFAAFAFIGLTHAHTRVHKSEPANNSTLSAAPKNLSLEFTEAVQLTALTLQKDDVKVQGLGPLPKETAKQITLALPALTSGNYLVQWRAVSADKHIMSGKLSFKVQ